jgi:hypothetical protein
LCVYLGGPLGPPECSTYTRRDFTISTEIKKMGAQVEQYVERQSSPQKEIVGRLRKIILRTFPDVKEEMKMGVPWYEGKLYVAALKDHVNLGFCLKGLSQKEKRLLEGSGRTMRHVKIHSLKDIDDKKIEKLLIMVRERWS